MTSHHILEQNIYNWDKILNNLLTQTMIFLESVTADITVFGLGFWLIMYAYDLALQRYQIDQSGQKTTNEIETEWKLKLSLMCVDCSCLSFNLYGWEARHMDTCMQIWNPPTSAKPAMTKLQNLFVALVKMDICQMTLKFSLLTVD